jgi:hypothetical protein
LILVVGNVATTSNHQKLDINVSTSALEYTQRLFLEVAKLVKSAKLFAASISQLHSPLAPLYTENWNLLPSDKVNS